MKNRLHDKKAGIAILISLIVLSLAEIIFRHFFLREMISSTANYAETLAVIILALAILIFTLKGKDRVCYILYGAWIAYFVLDQLFELPGVISYLITYSDFTFLILLSPVLHLISMICTIVIGILLVEYMNDGTIYNRAFNIISVVTVFLLMVNISISCFVAIKIGYYELLLESFNSLYRLGMVFLFTFFAYNSAKKQLSKVNFDK